MLSSCHIPPDGLLKSSFQSPSVVLKSGSLHEKAIMIAFLKIMANIRITPPISSVHCVFIPNRSSQEEFVIVRVECKPFLTPCFLCSCSCTPECTTIPHTRTILLYYFTTIHDTVPFTVSWRTIQEARKRSYCGCNKVESAIPFCHPFSIKLREPCQYT